MKIGVLQTDYVRPEWLEQFGEYPAMFEHLLSQVDPALELEVFDVQQQQYPADLHSLDGYLITGSKASVYDDLAWINRLSDFVVELHAARKKLVGICFGHQLIAQALGGKTQPSEKGWGVGRHTMTLTDQAVDYAPAGSQYSILVSHQDQVSIAARGAKVLAGSDFCPIAMCQIDDHILSFQGHPEFLPAYSLQLLDLRRKLYGDALYKQGLASLQQPLDQQQVASWIMGFFQHL